MLCNSLIQCHFDYATSTWYSSLNKQFRNRVQIMQNKVVHYIKIYGLRTSVQTPDFSGLGMLNVENRVRQMRLNHV